MADFTHQIRAASALMSLVATEDLPMCQWVMFSELGLEGYLVDREQSGDQMHELQMYAKKFGTQVVIDRATHYGITSGSYHGTPVRVLGKVDHV